jgi:hypothetical protein
MIRVPRMPVGLLRCSLGIAALVICGSCFAGPQRSPSATARQPSVTRPGVAVLKGVGGNAVAPRTRGVASAFPLQPAGSVAASTALRPRSAAAAEVKRPMGGSAATLPASARSADTARTADSAPPNGAARSVVARGPAVGGARASRRTPASAPKSRDHDTKDLKDHSR